MLFDTIPLNNSIRHIIMPYQQPHPSNSHSAVSNLIRRILHLLRRQKLLLNGPHIHKSRQQIRTPSFIIRAARPRASKGLLSDHSTCAFTVDVKVTRCVTEFCFCEFDCFPVFSEYSTCERVFGCGVDLLDDFGKGVGRAVVVCVDDEDGAEEFAGEERVVGVCG